MTDEKRADAANIEGEGSYEAARAYQKKQHAFAQSGRVEENARKAAEAVEREDAQEKPDRQS